MKRKKIIVGCVVIAMLYVTAYAVLSAMGGYRFDQSGLVRYEYGFGLSASDLEMWHPRWAWYQGDFTNIRGERTSRGNALGYFFSPMISLDRALLHNTKVIEEIRQAAKPTK